MAVSKTCKVLFIGSKGRPIHSSGFSAEGDVNVCVHDTTSRGRERDGQTGGEAEAKTQK